MGLAVQKDFSDWSDAPCVLPRLRWQGENSDKYDNCRTFYTQSRVLRGTYDYKSITCLLGQSTSFRQGFLFVIATTFSFQFWIWSISIANKSRGHINVFSWMSICGERTIPDWFTIHVDKRLCSINWRLLTTWYIPNASENTLWTAKSSTGTG